MPRQPLTPPPQPSADLDSPQGTLHDRVEYQFKPLFFPFLSVVIYMAVAFYFIGGTLFFIAIDSVHSFSNYAGELLLSFIIIESLLAYLFTRIKKFRILLTSTGIYGSNRWGTATNYIEWQQITSVKSGSLFGVNTLLVKTKDVTT